MRPLFHPTLVNGTTGDPCLYVEMLFQRRALLFDAGELDALRGRKVLRISDVFISHAHMDHFVGFDHIVRVCLGRDKALRVCGPPGLIDQVEHKLQAYTWNLVRGYANDFCITVTEAGHGDGAARRASFRVHTAFQREGESTVPLQGGRLLDDPLFTVEYALLDHGTPCLAYCLSEHRHVNIWKNRLQGLGLAVGPWLRGLKEAVLRGAPGDAPVSVQWRDGGPGRPATLPLALLQERVLQVTPGQRIAYVVDAAYHEANAAAIAALARDADVLYIETPFLHCEAAQAARKHHLTARQAGLLARRAGARRIEPMHFSARHAGDYGALEAEARGAFAAGGGLLDP